MIDLTAWLWGWIARVNRMRSVFSFCADCRSLFWARWWPAWTTETGWPRLSKNWHIASYLSEKPESPLHKRRSLKNCEKVWNSLRVMDANMNNTMRQCSRRCSDRRVEVWGRCIDWKLMVLHNTNEQIGIAGSHFGPYGYAISLFVMVAAEWKAIECYGTSSARRSSVSALG